LHYLLYENQNRLDDALLFQLPPQLHLDPGKLRQALASKEFEPRVRADFRGGAYDYASLVEAIEGVLV
jgi:hypothetical protein